MKVGDEHPIFGLILKIHPDGGMDCIDLDQLTEAKLIIQRADTEDVLGLKKWRKVMKDAGYDAGEVEEPT